MKDFTPVEYTLNSFRLTDQEVKELRTAHSMLESIPDEDIQKMVKDLALLVIDQSRNNGIPSLADQRSYIKAFRKCLLDELHALEKQAALITSGRVAMYQLTRSLQLDVREGRIAKLKEEIDCCDQALRRVQDALNLNVGDVVKMWDEGGSKNKLTLQYVSSKSAKMVSNDGMHTVTINKGAKPRAIINSLSIQRYLVGAYNAFVGKKPICRSPSDAEKEQTGPYVGGFYEFSIALNHFVSQQYPELSMGKDATIGDKLEEFLSKLK